MFPYKEKRIPVEKLFINSSSSRVSNYSEMAISIDTEKVTT